MIRSRQDSVVRNVDAAAPAAPSVKVVAEAVEQEVFEADVELELGNGEDLDGVGNGNGD
jgi:hypothetical protein